MIVLLHVSAGSIAEAMTMNAGDNLDFAISNIFDSMTRFAVPIFVMLSGAFQLSNEKNAQYGMYYKKVWHNIGMSTLVWSVVYVMYRIFYALFLCAIGYQIYDNTIFTMPFVQWAKGAPFYHMWYLYMALGLFLLTPVIIRAGKGLSQQTIFYIGIGFMALGMVTTETSVLFWAIKGIQYLGYYVLGYWIYQNKEQLKTKKTLFMIGSVLSWLCILGLTQVLKNLYFYGFLSVFVVFGSICIFSYFACISYNKEGITKYARYSFDIYLSHALILALLTDLFKFINLEFPTAVYIPVMTVLVFFMAFAMSMGLASVYKKFSK